jgi:hypothetical protein
VRDGHGRLVVRLQLFGLSATRFIVSSAMFACAYAAPARISAATQIASISSCSVAPFFSASSVWPRMQYGH